MRKKDLRRSTEKESLKGSRTESLLERARKNDTVPCRVKRIFTRFLKWKFVRKIAACDPQSVPEGDHEF